MTEHLYLDPQQPALYRTLVRGGATVCEHFDLWSLSWGSLKNSLDLDGLQSVTPTEAVRAIHAPGVKIRRVPVAVIGPKEATKQQYVTAEALGNVLGSLNVTMICGGRTGVMEAACKGVMAAGGLPMALLPDEEWQTANDFVAIPLATGIGPVRNALLARSAQVLIAVGGGYGTLSEMAYGLHFDRLVIGLEDAPEVQGVQYHDHLDAAVERMCTRILHL